MLENIDYQLEAKLRTAVNELAIQMGELYSGWQLIKAVQMKDFPCLYEIVILVQDGNYSYQGVAMVHPYGVTVMLSAAALYTLIDRRVDAKLAKYTLDHPWLLGV